MTSRPPTPVVIDTDIGTDPDDLLAILMVAASPELDLRAITTTYGETTLRAHIAAQTCRWIGIEPVIAIGSTSPISAREIWYAGNEQGQVNRSQLDEGREFPDAVDTILELSGRYRNELAIVAIGPLTNIAQAVLRDPTLPQRVAVLSIMGGDFADRCAAEHNFACDSEAARIVLEAGFNTRVIGVEQTRRLPLGPSDTQTWADGPHGPLRERLLADLDWWRTFHHTDDILVHDPLAVALVTHPHLFQLTPRSESVHTSGDWPGRLVATPGTLIDVVSDFSIAELQDIVVARIRDTLVTASSG